MTKRIKQKPNIYINNFILYGLNRKRNFLKCPSDDCGEKVPFVFEEDSDLFHSMAYLLYQHECPESAIFAVGLNNEFYAAVKMYDEEADEEVVQIMHSDDMHMFADLDGELRLCCYALLIEVEPGHWMIQE